MSVVVKVGNHSNGSAQHVDVPHDKMMQLGAKPGISKVTREGHVAGYYIICHSESGATNELDWYNNVTKQWDRMAFPRSPNPIGGRGDPNLNPHFIPASPGDDYEELRLRHIFSKRLKAIKRHWPAGVRGFNASDAYYYEAGPHSAASSHHELYSPTSHAHTTEHTTLATEEDDEEEEEEDDDEDEDEGFSTPYSSSHHVSHEAPGAPMKMRRH